MKKTTLFKSLLLLCALIVGSGSLWADNYELVTNVSQLSDGDKIIIASGKSAGSCTAIGAANNANNRKAVSVTVSVGTKTTITTDVDNANETTSGMNTANKDLTKPLEITLVASSSDWHLKEVLSNGNAFLNGGCSGNNHLKAATTVETATGSGKYNGVWSIDINTTTYVATITNKNSYIIKKNSSSALFASYSSGQNDVYIYKKQAPVITAADVNINADVLAGNITYSITNPDGSTLTAAKKSGDWLTVGAVDAVNNKVAFTATENTGASRNAVVTLTYGTITKDVTITQAAAAAKYTVTYDANPSNGTLTIKRGETTIDSGDEVSDGTILTVIATPSDDHDYKLSKWEYKEDGGSWTDGVGTSYTIDGKDVEFRATFVARIYHDVTWSVNGVTTTDEVEEDDDISFPASPSGVPGGYTFKGWVVEANKIDTPTDTDPSANYVTSASCTADITYYAVLAKSGMTDPTLTKQGSSAKFSADDNIVVVAKGTTYAMYQETVSSSYVKNYTFVNDAATIAANSKNYFTLSANSTNWSLGDDTNGYLYNSSSNNLSVSESKTAWTISWNNTESAFTIIGNSRWLSCRTDLTGDNQNKYRMGGATSGDPSGVVYFDIYKFVPGDAFYFGYCTTVPTINVSVSSAKYATFCDDVARNFSGKSITVYTAASNGSKVELSEIADGIVPANTGVVLFSDEVKNNIAIPAASTNGTGDYSGNEMVGIIVTTKVAADGGSGKTNYILSNEASGVGFYKATVSGANLGAHKAYLSTTKAASARDFLGFEENTTAIESITNSKEIKGEYFNLAGQRVAQPTKGLYIVNGKKVIK